MEMEAKRAPRSVWVSPELLGLRGSTEASVPSASRWPETVSDGIVGTSRGASNRQQEAARSETASVEAGRGEHEPHAPAR